MSKLWLTLNARWPLPDRRKSPRVSDNTVAREGDIFKEVGYVYDTDTDQWQAPSVLARGESIGKAASDTPAK